MIKEFLIQFKEVLTLQKSEFYFAFVKGHSNYFDNDIKQIKLLLNKNQKIGYKELYENKFAGIIGNGYALSFAAGRMAFYTLLKCFEIAKGDEVLITGFTCSVMINAILKVGATPVYVDIDPESLGTSAADLQKKITNKSKLIVAQHSFGIPCDIIKIADIAEKNNLILIEDCALAFDSKISGISVGNFGHASIFSTDHSKPINTLIGGMVYTKDENLFKRIKEYALSAEELDLSHQQRLLKRFLFEKKYYNPLVYKRTKLISFFKKIIKKIFLFDDKIVFLENEETAHNTNRKNDYPYPALLPEFLAYVGLHELKNWDHEKERRKQLLVKYINIVTGEKKTDFLPKAYLNKNLDIVPHRFIMFANNKKNFIEMIKSNLETSWFWFERPVVASKCSLVEFGYATGDCKTSEKIGEEIINFPTDLINEHEDLVLRFFKKSLNLIL